MILYPIILCLLAIALNAPPAEPAEARKIPVAIPSVSPSSTTFVVARDRGFYREEGLEVELIVMPAAQATQALIGGNVKFATVGGAGLPPLLRGAPLRFLFTTFSRPMYWLYANPEIRTVKELKGKKVGVSSIGSGPDSLLRELLKKDGLEGGREVVIMPLGSGVARFYALKAGSVDATMLSIPGNFMAEEAGFRQLASFIELDFVELQGSILVREDLLGSDPALAAKFVRASLKGLLYFRNNRADTVAILTRFLKVKPELTARIYDLILPGVTRDGTVGEEYQRRSVEHILERVGLKEPPPLEKIFDFSLTRKIRDDLRARGWKP